MGLLQPVLRLADPAAAPPGPAPAALSRPYRLRSGDRRRATGHPPCTVPGCGCSAKDGRPRGPGSHQARRGGGSPGHGGPGDGVRLGAAGTAARARRGAGVLGPGAAARGPAAAQRARPAGPVAHGRLSGRAAGRRAVRAQRDRQPLLHRQRRRQPGQGPADHGRALHQRRPGQQRLLQRHRLYPRVPGRPGTVRGVDGRPAARGAAVGEVLRPRLRRRLRGAAGARRAEHPGRARGQQARDRPRVSVPRARHRLPGQRQRPHHVREHDISAECDPAALRLPRLHRGNQRQPVGDAIQHAVADRHHRGRDRRLPGRRRHPFGLLQRPARGGGPRSVRAGRLGQDRRWPGLTRGIWPGHLTRTSPGFELRTFDQRAQTDAMKRGERMKTRAAVLHDAHKPFEIMELDLDAPKDGEVLIRYVAAGLCHSDLHLIDGDLVPRFPIVGGHEGAGIIEEVGPGVTKVKRGDHVVCSFIPNCGTCRYCSTGRQNLCDMGATILEGVMPDGTTRFHSGSTDIGGMCILGTFSERATISQHSLVKVDDWLPLETAVLVGCGVPTGWATANYAGGVRAGDTTVIYGIGGIGINAVQGAAAAGAKNVVVVDPLAFKRETALKLGATHAFASADEAAAKVNELTWGQMADQALVTVGTVEEEVVTSAFNVIGKGGTVVITGLANPEKLTVHVSGGVMTLFEKTIKGTLFGSANPQYDIVKLLRLYDAGQLKLDELVTTRYTLDQVNEGYQDLRDGKNIRGVIVYDTN